MADRHTTEPRQAFLAARSAVDDVLRHESAIASIAQGASLTTDTLRSSECIYARGNGGSLCDAALTGRL